MDVRMPDGTVIKNVPRGTTKAQLSAQLSLSRALEEGNTAAADAARSQLRAIKQGRAPSPAILGDLPPIGEAAMISIGRGLENVREGATGAGLGLAERFDLAPPGTQRAFQEEAQAGREFFGRTQLGETPLADVGIAAGETLPFMIAPQVGATARGRALAEGGFGALQGLLAPDAPGEGQLGDIAGGAATGILSQGALEQLPRLGSAFGDINLSDMSVIRNRMGDEAVQQLSDTAERSNVPLFEADLSPTAGKISSLAEEVPLIGTTANRRRQALAARRAAIELKENAIKDLDNLVSARSANLSDVERIAARDGHPRQGAAKRVLAELDDLDDDLGRQIQVSGDLTYLRRKLRADDLYDEAAQLAGDYVSSPSAFVDALDAEIEKLRTNIMPRQNAVMNSLGGIRDRLVTREEAEGLVSETVNPVTLQQLRDARSALNKEISGLTANPENNVEVAALTRIAEAVDNDLTRMAEEAGGGTSQAYKKADKFFRESVVPLRDRTIVKAMKGAESDQVINQFIKMGSGSRAKNFYNAMDEVGRAAVRAHILQRALKNATSRGREFNPGMMARILEDLELPREVYFRGQAGAELDGFTKLMRTIQDSGTALTDPKTGNRLVRLTVIGALGGVGSTFAPRTTGVVASGALLTKTLLATNAGRRFLRAASKTKSDKELIRLIQEKGDQIVTRSMINQVVAAEDEATAQEP